jgi:hypothetical protein
VTVGDTETGWVEPDQALADSATGDVLTTAQVAAWRAQGFSLVDDVLPKRLLERARQDCREAFPAAGSSEVEGMTDFGSGGRMEFPAPSAAANAMTLHPRLLRAVAQLLSVETLDLRLTQSDLWPKYGRKTRAGGDRDNADQRMHVDYPNHTLTHPPAWDSPEAVELIVYLSDVDECGGATALVPRAGPDDPAYAWPIVHTPGVAGLGWINDRVSAEASLRKEAPEVARFRAEHLYPREVRARYRPGTVLLYRHDTWHRGTPLLPGVARLAQNSTFRKVGSEWISVLQPGWAWAMYRPSQVMERLIAEASVEQRCVLGFPRPGHAYWTRETVDAVGARFGALGIDMAPYAEALPARLA